MGEAQDYRNALEEAYNTHWQNKVLLHPDAERAKRLLAQGKFPDYEDICHEILLVEYPEEVPHETAENYGELSWNYIQEDRCGGSGGSCDFVDSYFRLKPQQAESSSL